jgi:hypothetical protein
VPRLSASSVIPWFIVVVVLVMTSLVLAACGPGLPTAPVATRSTDEGKPTAPGQADLLNVWQGSKHAATFVSGDNGVNNDCARCHSPRNFAPASMADMPATCASCKFNIPVPKPIAQADWKSIQCDSCHKIEGGAAAPKAVWLNALVAEYDSTKEPYESVSNNTELCGKCHRDAPGFSYKIDMGASGHKSMQCTTCHDPHSLNSSCSAGTCHASVLKEAKIGHDAAHTSVQCWACHDASGLKVDKPAGQNVLTTFRATDARGKAVATPYMSHNLQRKVDCARCHYAGNPWGLAVK